MAPRKKKRSKKRRSPATRKSQELPGWLWMVFGLAVGLAVALAVYMRDRTPGAPEPVAGQTATVPAVVLDDNNETPVAAEPMPEQRFDFYNMLPNFEVIIPEQEPEVAVDREPKPIVQSGVYVLQAGSFSAYEDADRRRAQLALQGIESRIQRVTIDDRTYHRVRIGPIDNLEELNMTRSRLRQANIDVLRIRLGE